MTGGVIVMVGLGGIEGFISKETCSRSGTWFSIAIFVGGAPPYDFLKKIGVRFGVHDMTDEATTEAKRAVQEKHALAKAGSASA
jgi:hypothetical protein